jgi:heme-degrading monooxygenase HmoA
MFVAMSRFVVANGRTSLVKQAFIDRPHLVDAARGFVRLDVISPEDDPDEIWLITYWRNRDDFAAWHRSHAYHDAHAGIPKGLKLVPGRTQIRFFEHVAE